MNLGLGGRTVLITGAASGIGAAAATVMAAEGARIILTDRDKKGLDEAARQLRPAAGGRRHVTITADLGTADGVAAAIREATAAAGFIDTLISNAGQCQWRSFDELSDEAWMATLEINLMASVRILRHLLPPMRHRGRGCVVFTASDLARQPEAAPPDYEVSKAALLVLTKALARSEGPHIRVNAVAPGPTWTGLWSRPGGIADNLARVHGRPRGDAVTIELAQRQLPLARIGQPGEVANVIAFLASDAASYVTGSVYPVDGGSTRGL